ncbi:hypothetical protein ACQR16_24665 [Bradyrhizobium oligotrophicum]
MDGYDCDCGDEKDCDQNSEFEHIKRLHRHDVADEGAGVKWKPLLS